MKSAFKRSQYLLISSVFALTTLLGVVAFPQRAAAFAGGDGSNDDPYQIANCAQLQGMYDFEDYMLYRDKSYVLTADINCSGVTFYTLYDNPEYDFRGELDGQGYTISNVTIDNPENINYYQAGLFGYTYEASIQNLNLNNINIKHYGDEVGALIGHADKTAISKVFATNVTVSGESNVGGLIGTFTGADGQERGGRIYESSASGSVTGTGSNIGGLIGQVVTYHSNETTIYGVFAEAAVSGGTAHVGGLIGNVTSDSGGEGGFGTARADINFSYSWSTVASPNADNVGGLIGSLSNVGYDDSRINISDSYAWSGEGAISGDATVGGLIGLVKAAPDPEESSYAIMRTFALAEVAGNENRGGLIGVTEVVPDEDPDNTLYLLRNVYDRSFAGVSACDSDDILTDEGEDFQCKAINIEGEAPSHFINNQTNAPLDEWDFEEIWEKQTNTPPVYRGLYVEPQDDGQGDGDGDNAGPDSDEDTVSDAIEAAAPNNGDANNDGIADNEQSNVASLPNAKGDNYVSIELDETCSITNASTQAEAANATQDSGYSYSQGFVGFTANCGTNGYTATVKLYFYDADNGLVVRKHNPNTNAYFTIDSATQTAQTIGGKKAVVATYKVTDGGQLDVDGAPNGIIVDPVGLGSSMVNSPNTGVKSIQDVLFSKE